MLKVVISSDKDPASSSKNRDQNRDQNNSASSAASLNEKEGKEEIEENFKDNNIDIVKEMNEDYKNMRKLVSEAIKYGKGKYANDWEAFLDKTIFFIDGEDEGDDEGDDDYDEFDESADEDDEDDKDDDDIFILIHK